MSHIEMQARAERRRYIDDAFARTVLALDHAIRRAFCAVFAGSAACR